MTTRVRRRGTQLLGTLVVGLLLLALAACSSDSGPERVVPMPLAERRPAVSTVDGYCQIQALRQMISDGEIERSDLPDFADLTEVDGTPLIRDFTKRHPDSDAEFLDRLFSSAGLQSVRPSRAAVSSCIENATEADVRRSQGGPGYMSRATQRGDLESCGGFGCYEIPDITATYCEVQGIRNLVRHDALSQAALPRDADLTIRDGAPLLIDFRSRDNYPSRAADYLTSSLRPAVVKAGTEIDRTALRACLDSTTQSTIEKTQGGPSKR